MTMKLNYCFVLLALIVGVIFWPAQRASAQDTLVVEWWDGTEVIPNALRDAIATDTTSTGEHVAVSEIPNRVYKLYRGGYYWLEDRIENDGFHLRIVGEEPGATIMEAPAVIQMVEDADGNVDGRIITGKASVTLKNLWLTGNDNAGVQTYYQPIQMDASNSRFVIENCVLTRTNFAPIAFTGKNNDIFYKDCVFRNLIGRPSTQQWEGRGISIWADQDTVIVENCTFFNVGMTAFQLEGGAANYVGFFHNTLVNIGRGITSGNWWREGYFANNLVVNGFWHSEGAGDLDDPNRDPRNTTNGMFTIGDLPSMYGVEKSRRVVFANANSWRDPRFATYYADSLLAQPFLSPVSILDYINVYDAMVSPDLTSLDPGLTTTFDNAQIDSMIQNIEDLRAGVTPATPYAYELPTQHTAISWPLPENFTYTNSTLLTAGTDELPLGDLNWFPTQKATWEANRAVFMDEIKMLAGGIVILEITDATEAEDGTLAGDAAVETVSGFKYFAMEGGGSIKWEFDLTTGGVYGMNVWSNLRSQGMRGEHFKINGETVRCVVGWGELEFRSSTNSADWMPNRGVGLNQPDTLWSWYFFPKDSIHAEVLANFVFVDGTNTIEITPSWGYQDFAGIDLIADGVTPPLAETVTGSDLVIALRATDATYSIVTPVCEDAVWVPEYFKSVAMGTNGTITWNFDAPEDGVYMLNIFYQNYIGSQTGEIKVDGVTVISDLALESDADSTGLDVLSDTFNMTAGSHAITLTGSNINVDYVQLVQEKTVSSIRPDSNIPQGYALKQNYPNPFNPTTTINYSISKNENIKLIIYNVLGQEVKTLVNRNQPAGSYMVIWDGTSDTGFQVSTGIYFCKMITPEFTKTKKMMLLK